MTRNEAAQFTHNELEKWGIKDWHVRINTNVHWPYVGLCSYKDKAIILNAHHIDIHPEAEVKNTIRHEIAHALTPGHGHDDVWAVKAREVGCDNVGTHCSMGLDHNIIDAIRSGADVEVTVEEQVIRTPKYKVTRLQDKCQYCGKVAITKSENKVVSKGDTNPDLMFIKLECGHMIVKKIPKGTPFHTFQMGGDPTCEHDWDKNLCVKCGRAKPFPFQLEGMRFAEQALAVNDGVAFLDEMGLGKTIQAGGVIFFHPEIWPCLWVVKSSLKFQTFSFIYDWMGEKHIAQIIHKSSDTLIPGLKHYIISYDLMVPKIRKNKKTGKIITQGFDIQKIIKSPIKTIILDECQHVKNTDSSRTQQVRQICKGRKVIALSGTPWKNKGGELFSVLNMIAHTKFPFHQKFLDEWVDFWWHGKYLKQGGIKNPAKFREYIKDIAIRRERKEVMPELPSTVRTKLNVQFTLDQNKEYDEAVEAFAQWYEASVMEQELSGIAILGKISRLKHLTGIAKIPATIEYVKEFMEDTDKKIVVFVHHQDVGESIYQQLKDYYSAGKDEDGEELPAIPVLKLTSALSSEDRFHLCNKFNATARCIMIASTLASGEGLNLQTGSDCVMHERQWNPANEEQAEGRFCRIGQKSPEINAVYTQVMNSIDSYSDQIVERKRRWFHTGMNKGEAPQWNQDEILRELADIIVTDHRRRNPKKLTAIGA